MKTTLEIPDSLFRCAKSLAAQRGIPLRALVCEALTEKVNAKRAENKPWLESFGKLRHLHRETAKLNRVIEQEFGRIDAEDWN